MGARLRARRQLPFAGMTHLELTRTPEDRHVYALGAIGTLRLSGWGSRAATAEAGERRWEIAGRGIFAQVLEARDASGTVVGDFKGRTLARGGTLNWGGRELALRHSGIFRQRFALCDGERELATIEGSGWGKRPVRIDVDDTVEIVAGLLLFAAYVVNQIVKDDSASASVTTV